MQQIFLFSLFIFILLQIFSNFPHYSFLDAPIIFKWTFNLQIHGIFKVSLILIFHFDVNFSFKCFFSLQLPSVYFFRLLTLLKLSMAKSNISLGKCHIALENIFGISQEACQVGWYSHHFKNFPQFVVIHTIKGFGTVSKADIDVFLELSCFSDDPADVGNLISGS